MCFVLNFGKDMNLFELTFFLASIAVNANLSTSKYSNMWFDPVFCMRKTKIQIGISHQRQSNPIVNIFLRHIHMCCVRMSRFLD